VAIAPAVAIYLHRKTHLMPCGLGFDKPVCAVRSSWQDPVALLVVVTGIAAALAVILFGRRRFVARS
jgi:type IV secretory pathway VirB2 component (pilin)